MTEGDAPVRQRSRMACEPCRQRKRKCNGKRPCDMCDGYDYGCYYRSTPRRRRRSVASKPSPASQAAVAPSPRDAPQAPGEAKVVPQQASPQTASTYIRSLESNSGAVFVRTLRAAVDPSDVPPLQILGWNLFLGERHGGYMPSMMQTNIAEILSLSEMHRLFTRYFETVDRCYGFIDRNMLEQQVSARWLPGSSPSLHDAVFCGVAALGYLFGPGRATAVELDLVDLAKSLLDLATREPPSLQCATGWVLRTVYLRLTSNPDEAWLSSCTALHVVDAAGLHQDSHSEHAFCHRGNGHPPDIGKRVFAVAQHLNIWMSFDLGRSRVVLQNATTNYLSDPPQGYTTELLGLLPYVESLDPSHGLAGSELLGMLNDVLDRTHTVPGSVLAQTNMVLCIYRRLHNIGQTVPAKILEKSLAQIRRSFECVHVGPDEDFPWHHVVNVPFQNIACLLVMDTNQSLSLLGPALACLDQVNYKYQTKATGDAVAAARALVYAHHKRRSAEVDRQSQMLRLYPVTTPPNDDILGDLMMDPPAANAPWLRDIAADFNPGNLTGI